jgi:hypothetical protein
MIIDRMKMPLKDVAHNKFANKTPTNAWPITINIIIGKGFETTYFNYQIKTYTSANKVDCSNEHLVDSGTACLLPLLPFKIHQVPITVGSFAVAWERKLHRLHSTEVIVVTACGICICNGNARAQVWVYRGALSSVKVSEPAQFQPMQNHSLP